MHAEFEVHLLNDLGIAKAKRIAQEFDDFLTKIENLVPQGRSFSIVKTKLEEASFFAKKGMASEPYNQKAQG